MLGWRESFDLLLSSKSEWDPVVLCLSVEGTCVPMCGGVSLQDAEGMGTIIVVVAIITIP